MSPHHCPSTTNPRHSVVLPPLAVSHWRFNGVVMIPASSCHDLRTPLKSQSVDNVIPCCALATSGRSKTSCTTCTGSGTAGTTCLNALGRVDFPNSSPSTASDAGVRGQQITSCHPFNGSSGIKARDGGHYPCSLGDRSLGNLSASSRKARLFSRFSRRCRTRLTTRSFDDDDVDGGVKNDPCLRTRVSLPQSSPSYSFHHHLPEPDSTHRSICLGALLSPLEFADSTPQHEKRYFAEGIRKAQVDPSLW